MYDINMRNVKKGAWIYYLFIIVGVVFMFLMITIFINNQNNLKKMDKEVISTSVTTEKHYDDGEYEYLAIYHYQVNGQNYSCRDSSYSARPKNDNKVVYYEANNPQNCSLEKPGFSYVTLLSLIIPFVFIIIGIYNVIKQKQRVKVIEQLNKTGKLIKNIPYHLENSGVRVNDRPVKCLVVDYVLPSGSIVPLYSDLRYDKALFDKDGMVDLVIDENNPNNYFIDFEINRLSGNLPEDYNKGQFAKPNAENNLNNINTIDKVMPIIKNLQNNQTNNINQADNQSLNNQDSNQPH